MNNKKDTDLDIFLKRGVFSQKVVRSNKGIEPSKTFVGNLGIKPSELLAMREVKSFVGSLVKTDEKLEQQTKDTESKVSEVIHNIKKVF